MTAKLRQLTVVAGGEKPDSHARQWTCPRCPARIGIATSTVIEIVTSPMTVDGKFQSGTKQLICAYCWRDGIVTPASAPNH